MCFKHTSALCVGFAAGIAGRREGGHTWKKKKGKKDTTRAKRGGEGGVGWGERGGGGVNREITHTCHTFQYGSEESSGVVPRKL